MPACFLFSAELQAAFRSFGRVEIKFPVNRKTPRGYAYAIFESDTKVKAMLRECNRDGETIDKFYLKLFIRRKSMQVKFKN